MGLILEYGIGKPAADLQAAIMCYKKASNDGIAQLRLGICFAFKKPPPDLEKAKTNLELAKTQTPDALYALGRIADEEKNDGQRDALIYEAYKQGSPMPHVDLVAIKRNSQGQLTENENDFINLYMECIARGNANSLINLVNFYKLSHSHMAIFIARFAAELGGKHNLLAELVKEQRESLDSFSAFYGAIGLRDSKEHTALFTECKDAVKCYRETAIELHALNSDESGETLNFLLDFDKDENFTDQEKDVMILVTPLLTSNLSRDITNLIMNLPSTFFPIQGMLLNKNKGLKP